MLTAGTKLFAFIISKSLILKKLSKIDGNNDVLFLIKFIIKILN